MKLAKFFALLLLPSWTHAAPPEMWVVHLDHKIPSVSPAGRTNFQLGFVLRVCGTQQSEQMVALFHGVGVHLRDSSGKDIPSEYRQDREFAPIEDDFVVVTSGKVRQRTYVITMQAGVLSVHDGAGGVRTFKVSPGEITAEVMFDARPLANYEYLAPFEEKYFGWDRRKVFRGPMNCGKFEIEVAAAKYMSQMRRLFRSPAAPNSESFNLVPKVRLWVRQPQRGSCASRSGAGETHTAPAARHAMPWPHTTACRKPHFRHEGKKF